MEFVGPWTVHNVLFEAGKSTFAVTVHWTVTAFCQNAKEKKKKKKTQNADAKRSIQTEAKPPKYVLFCGGRQWVHKKTWIIKTYTYNKCLIEHNAYSRPQHIIILSALQLHVDHTICNVCSIKVEQTVYRKPQHIILSLLQLHVDSTICRISSSSFFFGVCVANQ